MTVAKSKYYMLKVNYPELAEKIDNEPVAPEPVEEETPSASFAQPQKMKKLEEQAQFIDQKEDSEQDRQAVFKKDKMTADMYDQITEELVNQMQVFKEMDRMHE
jgi:hypothetical protein